MYIYIYTLNQRSSFSKIVPWKFHHQLHLAAFGLCICVVERKGFLTACHRVRSRGRRCRSRRAHQQRPVGTGPTAARQDHALVDVVFIAVRRRANPACVPGAREGAGAVGKNCTARQACNALDALLAAVARLRHIDRCNQSSHSLAHPSLIMFPVTYQSASSSSSSSSSTASPMPAPPTSTPRAITRSASPSANDRKEI